MRLNELAMVYECEKCGYTEIIYVGDQPSESCPACGYNENIPDNGLETPGNDIPVD